MATNSNCKQNRNEGFQAAVHRHDEPRTSPPLRHGRGGLGSRFHMPTQRRIPKALIVETTYETLHTKIRRAKKQENTRHKHRTGKQQKENEKYGEKEREAGIG